MRESNFAFPAQNRACVCISSQLYDRRALDTESPLPLFNSLTHLVYLTSTSPRIREIMTMDGGLERLVRILHNFCICPPSPENPTLLYGLSPANSRPSKIVPTLNPQTWDKHAAYRFSLAFQCLVNIGVRGNEVIRSRVVQAGTLDVVGMILEAWLVSKGFAVGPSTSATGMPRETKEQRAARRQAMVEQRQRDQAQALTQALQRTAALEHVIRLERAATGSDVYGPEDIHMSDTPADVAAQDSSTAIVSEGLPRIRARITDPRSSSTSDADTSTDTSTNSTPVGSNTPTGAVMVPGRERSGTIIGRPAWDPTGEVIRGRTRRARDRQEIASTSTSAGNSRPDTETEDDGDGDGDIDMDGGATHDSDTPPSPRPRGQRRAFTTQRRAVGIVSDAPPDPTTGPSLEVNSDAHIIINHAGGMGGDVVGVEDGIVSLEPNDDFAMGAPPGAPGAIEDAPTIRGADLTEERMATADLTPRAGNTNLPTAMTPFHLTMHTPGRANGRDALARNAGTSRVAGFRGATQGAEINATTATPTGAGLSHHHHHHHHHRDSESGPYRDEDVLLSLQLLAYLSKYPHVRQAFYKPRTSFHPATANLPNPNRNGYQPTTNISIAGPSGSRRAIAATPVKEPHSIFKAFTSATGRGKEKEKPQQSASTASSSSSITSNATRHTNVFSLVERFTFRPSSSEADLPNAPPPLPHDIQYWAGAIMRNACRKDDSRGGIRQCANMLCGKWESFPREFAKCRRCRKAKYCGKECQSTAWSEGHRFWCSAKDGDEEGENTQGERPRSSTSGAASGEGNISGMLTTATGTVTGRAERRVERERERQARDRDRNTLMGVDAAQVTRAMTHAFRSTATTHHMMNPNAGPVDATTPAAHDGADTTQTRAGWAHNAELGRRQRPRVPFSVAEPRPVDPSDLSIPNGRWRPAAVTLPVRVQPPPLPPRYPAIQPSIADEEAGEISVSDDMSIASVDEDMEIG